MLSTSSTLYTYNNIYFISCLFSEHSELLGSILKQSPIKLRKIILCEKKGHLFTRATSMLVEEKYQVLKFLNVSDNGVMFKFS
jgi:hypothetical protein